MTAFPVPATAVTGTMETAAFWNAQVRDTATWLLAPIMYVGKQTAIQPLDNGTWTSIVYDTTILDRGSGHSTLNPSHYIGRAPGWYEVTGIVATGQSSQGLGVRLAVNGTPVSGAATTTGATPLGATGNVTKFPVYLNGTGDYVEVQAFQTTGGRINTTSTADFASSMHVRYVSTP